ncbi:CubicO group peptidase (beta-lactamase class C family) [Thermocatellispora tengchongensis]|uniref:CubicO group peptidase (Beta-lactamase class C family) n=1 Tax=Thermocatellispora tengchongensis TaxID=1073253 RepID=A0A840PGL9_9ACTN|nr:serine hydrolase domain-containing protein [Thermocatellispora tengchongensis]MBB5136981.1 CubicO group peptidase (beta-lactamase class C family) [Thermocatellispora tengchongensis]
MWPVTLPRLLLVVVLSLGVVSVPAPASAADIPDTRELTDFFDAAMARGLEANHVPGAVVSVVGGGRNIFSKGYGLADRENRTPFDPETSLVRIASITKLFTWTAVMQQVQQGRLDLHADVNRYLTTFKIPATYPQPITLAHLMSHTAGFEDSAIGLGSRSKADVPPLGTYLAERLPARVRPPGLVSAYSNYGAALAGYIVSQVSGQPYDQYVQAHILDPLGMRHSTAAEPVPAALAAGQARSYDYDEGTYQRKPFVFDNLAPDGSISATANDMARFMIAHLRSGPLLDEPTARLMHQRSFAADPRIDGYAHGFKEQTLNGHRVIMHDGAWEGFASLLLLVPDADLGLFVSTNGVGGIDAVTELLPAFFDRFLPGDRAAPASSGRTAAPVAGFYKPTRSVESTIEKVLTLTGSSRLRIEDGGKLAFLGKTWSPLAPGLYQQDGGWQRLAFVTDGAATYAATDGPAYELIPWWDTPPANLVVVLTFAVTALTAVLGLPLTAAIRRLRRRPSRTSRAWRAGRLLAGLAGAVGLVFIVLFTLMLTGETSILYGVPDSLRALLLLPPLFLALTVAAITTTVIGWRRQGPGVLARGHQVVLLAGMLALVWFCRHWNLLGWQFG